MKECLAHHAANCSVCSSKLADERRRRSPHTEAAVLAAVRQVFGQAPGFVVWRNTSGFVEHETRKVRYGVATGGADLLGIAPGGLFFASEVKQLKGRVTDEQLRFLELVYIMGGVACVTRSAEEAEEQVRGIRAGIRRHGF